MRDKLGECIGTFSYFILKKRRLQALENLTYAFPDLSRSELQKIAKGSFQNLGITFLELLAMKKFTDAELHKIIKYENIELINDTYAEGNGVMFLSGHYGNWELLAYSVGAFTNIPATIIVKPQSNSFADAVLNSYRTSRGNKIVSMYSAARTIISVITKGEAIALLVDQAATEDKDLFINFFNRPASTYKVVAELALRFHIPIIMGFSVRLADGTYSVKLKKINYSDLKNNKSGVLELTHRHVKVLEDMIKQRPELWAWMHRRWKHRKK